MSGGSAEGASLPASSPAALQLPSPSLPTPEELRFRREVVEIAEREARASLPPAEQARLLELEYRRRLTPEQLQLELELEHKRLDLQREQYLAERLAAAQQQPVPTGGGEGQDALSFLLPRRVASLDPLSTSALAHPHL